MFKKYILPGIIALAAGFLYFYMALPAINVRDGGFWFMLVLVVVLYIVLCVVWSRRTPIVQIIDGKPHFEKAAKLLWLWQQ